VSDFDTFCDCKALRFSYCVFDGIITRRHPNPAYRPVGTCLKRLDERESPGESSHELLR
jgi:hypothetical protein